MSIRNRTRIWIGSGLQYAVMSPAGSFVAGFMFLNDALTFKRDYGVTVRVHKIEQELDGSDWASYLGPEIGGNHDRLKPHRSLLSGPTPDTRDKSARH